MCLKTAGALLLLMPLEEHMLNDQSQHVGQRLDHRQQVDEQLAAPRSAVQRGGTALRLREQRHVQLGADQRVRVGGRARMSLHQMQK